MIAPLNLDSLMNAIPEPSAVPWVNVLLASVMAIAALDKNVTPPP